MSNKEQVAMALRVLCAAWPTHKASPETLAVYTIALMDLDYDVLQRAVLWCVTHSRFFPTVAEIREAIGSSAPDSERLPGADEAWGEVMREIRRVGSWGIPQFSHAMVADTVERIGWREICLSTEPGVVRGQFFKIYAITHQRSVEKAQALPDDHPVMAAMTALAGKMRMLGSE